MTVFESVSLAVGIAGALAALVALPTFVLMWIQATGEQKEHFRQFWAKLGQKAYRGWVYLSCVILVSTGVWKIIEFSTSTQPLTRIDIVLYSMNLISLIVFSVISLITIVAFQVMDQKKRVVAETR